MKEVESYRKLQQEKDQLVQEYEEKHKLMIESHERMIAEMTEDYEVCFVPM